MDSTSSTDRSLSQLFQRLRPRLLAAGRRLLGNDDDASDAVQDTFEKLWKKSASHSEAVVVTAMRNICIDSLRSRKPTDPLTDSLPVAETDSETGALYHEVNQVIEQALSSRDREILILRDRDGWEFDSIAERTGLTEANVRVILSRARRTVRDVYRQQFKAK